LALGAALASCGRFGFDLLPASRSSGVVGASGAGSDASPDAQETTRTPDAAPISNGGATSAVDCTGSVPQVEDFCQSVPKLPVVPVIDGLPDCGISTAPFTPLGFDADAGRPDAVAQYAVAARPDGLYVYVVVTDPTALVAAPTDPADDGDAVEIYVDSDGAFSASPAYDAPGTRRFVIAAPSNGASVSTRADLWTNPATRSAWSSSRFQARSRSFGYIVEAFIGAEDLGVPKLDLESGQKVGLDLAIDVSFSGASMTGQDGHRLGRYYLHLGSAGAVPTADVGAFCTPTVL
jgi:hypothetical protein